MKSQEKAREGERERETEKERERVSQWSGEEEWVSKREQPKPKRCKQSYQVIINDTQGIIPYPNLELSPNLRAYSDQALNSLLFRLAEHIQLMFMN